MKTNESFNETQMKPIAYPEFQPTAVQPTAVL